ncbi:MAG TPA: immunoglobulin domain-containing protein, partial [Candidatus Binatia bacterium]|nr:immunoglobulin domain-containing protein [Candidatus Binatia bacterium]
MKTQPPKLILKTALMAALSLAASGAFAAPICVKFVNSNNPGVQNSVADSLAPADVAGAPGFMHLHWNNMGVSGQTLPVADTSSNATGVTITWASPDTWHSGAGLGTPNEKLMSGYLDSTRVTNGVDNPFDFSGSGATDNRPDVYATGLSGWLATQGATSYSVVVYSDSDSTGGGIAEYWVQSPADANDPPQALGSDLTPRIFRSDNGTFSGTFTQVPLNANTYGTASNGNYIVFAGLTSDSLVIRTEDSFSGFNAAPINGIQFIPNSLKPVIELQPHQVPSGTLASGGSFTLNAFVSGPSLYYQWLKDGTNVPGASTNFYSATGITTGDSGDYKLVVTNAYGSVTSSVVSVTVSGEAAPSGAVVSPASINRGVGSTVIFSVTADGSEPFTHQWYDGATALAGETNATLTLSPVLAADAGSYTCAVTNSLGGTVSSAGVLTTFQPAGTTIAVNFMDYYSGASHDPVASTAFGIDPANWVNVDAGEQFIGSTTASGVAVSWSCKNTWSQTPSYSAYSAGGMAFLTGYLDDGVDG